MYKITIVQDGDLKDLLTPNGELTTNLRAVLEKVIQEASSDQLQMFCADGAQAMYANDALTLTVHVADVSARRNTE